MSANDFTFNMLYVELEPMIMPIIKSCADRFHRSLGMGLDDAYQEGRIALMEALQSYDYNRSHGGIYSYARRAVERAMLGLLYQVTARQRMPNVLVTDDVTGETKLVRRWPTLLEPGMMDNLPEVSELTPERAAEEAEMVGRLQVLKMRLVNSLGAQEQAIFSCMAHPSDEFVTFLRNVGAKKGEDPSNVHIAKFLGLRKNTVDWSIHKIKRAFARLAEAEFSDVVQAAVREGKWPMLYVSFKENDTAHVSKTIATRKLDPRPSAQREVKKRGEAVRVIETYEWGSVLFLRLDDETATVVCEGRFNAITGEVFGDGGVWKSLTDEVWWYPDLLRALKAKQVADED